MAIATATSAASNFLVKSSDRQLTGSSEAESGRESRRGSLYQSAHTHLESAELTSEWPLEPPRRSIEHYASEASNDNAMNVGAALVSERASPSS
jgi:hypothetical protein